MEDDKIEMKAATLEYQHSNATWVATLKHRKAWRRFDNLAEAQAYAKGVEEAFPLDMEVLRSLIDKHGHL